MTLEVSVSTNILYQIFWSYKLIINSRKFIKISKGEKSSKNGNKYFELWSQISFQFGQINIEYPKIYALFPVKFTAAYWRVHSLVMLPHSMQTYRKPVDLWIYLGADSLSGGQHVYIKARHIWFRGCFCHGTNLSVDAGALEVAFLPVSICKASYKLCLFKIRSNMQ